MSEERETCRTVQKGFEHKSRHKETSTRRTRKKGNSMSFLSDTQYVKKHTQQPNTLPPRMFSRISAVPPVHNSSQSIVASPYTFTHQQKIIDRGEHSDFAKSGLSTSYVAVQRNPEVANRPALAILPRALSRTNSHKIDEFDTDRVDVVMDSNIERCGSTLAGTGLSSAGSSFVWGKSLSFHGGSFQMPNGLALTATPSGNSKGVGDLYSGTTTKRIIPGPQLSFGQNLSFSSPGSSFVRGGSLRLINSLPSANGSFNLSFNNNNCSSHAANTSISRTNSDVDIFPYYHYYNEAMNTTTDSLMATKLQGKVAQNKSQSHNQKAIFRCIVEGCKSAFDTQEELDYHKNTLHSLEAAEKRECDLQKKLSIVERNHAVLREYSSLVRRMLTSSQVTVSPTLNPFTVIGGRPKRLFRGSKPCNTNVNTDDLKKHKSHQYNMDQTQYANNRYVFRVMMSEFRRINVMKIISSIYPSCDEFYYRFMKDTVNKRKTLACKLSKPACKLRRVST